MKRRSFLSLIGMAPAAVAVSASTQAALVPETIEPVTTKVSAIGASSIFNSPNPLYAKLWSNKRLAEECLKEFNYMKTNDIWGRS